MVAAWVDLPVDRIVSMLIVVVVAKTGWELLSDAMRVLLDASLDRTTLDHVTEVIDGDPAVREVKWVTGRSAGRFRFVEAGVAFRIGSLDLAETAIHRIEAEIRSSIPYVDRALIHVEASASPYVQYAIPLADETGSISEHFGEAPFFALVMVLRRDGSLHEQRVMTNPYREAPRAKGIGAAEWLVAQNVDVVVSKRALYGKGPEHVFGEAGVELVQTDASTMVDVLAELRGRTQTANGKPLPHAPPPDPMP